MLPEELKAIRARATAEPPPGLVACCEGSGFSAERYEGRADVLALLAEVERLQLENAALVTRLGAARP